MYYLRTQEGLALRALDARKGDEISTAPPAVQAALLRVVLERVVGDLELPDGVAVIAAANPPEQAAGGWDLSATISRRHDEEAVSRLAPSGAAR